MEAIVAAIVGAVAGIMGGWVFSLLEDRRAEERRSRRELAASAFVILDRVFKLQAAAQHSLEKQLDDEFWFLGADLDRYRNAIADNRKARAEHWPVYEQLRTVLREHDMELMNRLEGPLRRIAGLSSDV